MPRTIVVDPSIIWIINGSESFERASVLIEIASRWLGRRSDEMRRLSLTRAGVQALYDANVVPSEPYFQDVLEKVGLKGVIGARQLATAVAKFLASVDCVDDEAPFKEALFDNKLIDPNPALAFGHNSLQDISIDTACFIALNTKAGARYIWGLCSDLEPNFVNVKADVIEAVPPYYGDEIEQKIEIVYRDTDYYRTLSSSDIWREANSSEHYSAAICLKSAEIDGINLETPEQAKSILKRFSLGPKFIATLGEGQAVGRGEFCSTVLQKCAQIISENGNIEINDFRVSAGKHSGARKRARDGAVAKRVHVTDAKRGLRLMFWKKTDGSVEFATLANKFDEYIDE